MDNSRQPPRVDVDKSEESTLVRQSSLRPGEVRTPTMVVTLSEAWGDVSSDWAAPGSSVWEEDAPSRHSAQTPLTGYGREGDVWASATGSPLLGDDGADAVNAFVVAAATCQGNELHENPADAAELAAAALQAFVPRGATAPHVAPQSHRGPAHPQPPASSFMPTSQREERPLPRRYAPEANYNYEDRFGTVHAAPTSDPVRGVLGGGQRHTAQPQPNAFTVHEGNSGGARGGGGTAPFNSSSAARNYGIPILANDVNQHVGSGGGGGGAGLFSGSGSGGVAYVPRLDDEEVAQSIIASAGLPLSLNSLVEYIRGGQPQALSHVSALGSTQNALRNYPNLNEPPSEEDSINNNVGGARGGRPQQPSYTQSLPQQQQGRWNQYSVPVAKNTGFAVCGGDYGSGGGPQRTSMPPSTLHGNSDASGGFVVSAGNEPAANRRVSPQTVFGGSPNNPHQHHSHGSMGGGGGGTGRHKSESEYLSDLLHFHANFFPPPPPPRVPKEERRNRAELWYHYASKWDITHRLPPPPRTPLPEMEMEYRMRLQRMTRVPYHGDGWLQMAEQWFCVMQALFDFPEENMGVEVDFNVVLQQAVLS
ncbi:hypothetical protein ABL78_2838 [Leptomonas seymouri]|uniref:Uncharacterized protein n=1 Tax=Leptomonas seymouri TaxID=5684 RepID=A0A0N1PC95_LEPSE|nr:hypothetical protein ABL78_2838 [Leptomonas seymouri]|eukprot:KPI88062.1 hypothetical protein ABL78_2838 [Leptomonas seymouri]